MLLGVSAAYRPAERWEERHISELLAEVVDAALRGPRAVRACNGYCTAYFARWTRAGLSQRGNPHRQIREAPWEEAGDWAQMERPSGAGSGDGGRGLW